MQKTKLRRALGQLLNHLDGRDVSFALGVLALGAGCGWIYPPAGLIAVGAVVTAVSVFGVRS
jgi:TRAP-type C4-dicarboxylate transport system permease large subunit